MNRWQHDAAAHSSDKLIEEVVTVHDRRHPLFGRSFRVAFRSNPTARGVPHVFVFRRDGILLRLPASALLDLPPTLPATKLTCEAAAELRAAALDLGVLPCVQDNCGDPCPNPRDGESLAISCISFQWL